MRKRNNKGLTLIELIVSIAILAIVVLPLLTAFIISLKTNAKAKEKLRAVDIAHNFMEGMEAESVTDILTQLTYDDNFSLLANKGKKFNPKSIEVIEREGKFIQAVRLEDVPEYVVNKEELVTSSVMRDQSGNFIIKEKDSKKYYFYINQIVSDTKVFDALITIDGNMRSDGGDPSLKSIPKYNTDISVADIENVNLSFDAVNTKVKTIAEVIQDINKAKATNMILDDAQYISRTTYITIEHVESSSTSNGAKVTVKYVFDIKGCPKRDKDGNKILDEATGMELMETDFSFPEANSSYELDYTEVIFDNTNTPVGEDSYLKNVYFYFMPWYESEYSINPNDERIKEHIWIENRDKMDCTVKLIKQQALEDGNALDDAEKKYCAVVHLLESGNPGGSAEKAHVKFETNLYKNLNLLSKENDEYEKSFLGTQAIFVLDGQPIFQSDWKNKVYDPVDQDHSHSNGDPKNYKMWISTGFGVNEARTRLYEVRVDIFPTGTGFEAACEKKQSPIVSLTGGLTD